MAKTFMMNTGRRRVAGVEKNNNATAMGTRNAAQTVPMSSRFTEGTSAAM